MQIYCCFRIFFKHSFSRSLHALYCWVPGYEMQTFDLDMGQLGLMIEHTVIAPRIDLDRCHCLGTKQSKYLEHHLIDLGLIILHQARDSSSLLTAWACLLRSH